MYVHVDESRHDIVVVKRAGGLRTELDNPPVIDDERARRNDPIGQDQVGARRRTIMVDERP